MRRVITVVALLCVVGCATGASQQNIERSFREFQLAASLREEGQTASAIEHLRKAIDLDSDNAEAHLLLGFIQMERRAYIQAEEHLRTGIDRLVKLEREGATLAEARNLYGVCLIELERYDDAVAVLEKSAADDLNTAPHLAWGNLGLAQFKAGRFEDAITSTEEAVRIERRFCIGFYTMGQALYELKRFDKAEQALVQAIEADPECKDTPALQGAWRLRGQVRITLRHTDDARADLERCVELGPYTEHGRACQYLLDGGSK